MSSPLAKELSSCDCEDHWSSGPGQPRLAELSLDSLLVDSPFFGGAGIRKARDVLDTPRPAQQPPAGKKKTCESARLDPDDAGLPKSALGAEHEVVNLRTATEVVGFAADTLENARMKVQEMTRMADETDRLLETWVKMLALAQKTREIIDSPDFDGGEQIRLAALRAAEEKENALLLAREEAKAAERARQEAEARKLQKTPAAAKKHVVPVGRKASTKTKAVVTLSKSVAGKRIGSTRCGVAKPAGSKQPSTRAMFR